MVVVGGGGTLAVLCCCISSSRRTMSSHAFSTTSFCWSVAVSCFFLSWLSNAATRSAWSFLCEPVLDDVAKEGAVGGGVLSHEDVDVIVREIFYHLVESLGHRFVAVEDLAKALVVLVSSSSLRSWGYHLPFQSSGTA